MHQIKYNGDVVDTHKDFNTAVARALSIADRDWMADISGTMHVDDIYVASWTDTYMSIPEEYIHLRYKIGV